MWNPFGLNSRSGHPNTIADQEYSRGERSIGPTTATQHQGSYARDVIVRGAEHDPAVAIISQSKPHLAFNLNEIPRMPPASFVRNPISNVEFRQREKMLLDCLAAHPGEPVPLAQLSAHIQKIDKTTQKNIKRIDEKLKGVSASTILQLEAIPLSPAAYVMESAQPVIMKESEHCQLMQHSFASTGTNGQLHEIAIRHDEFLLLNHLMDHPEDGASREALEHLIGPPAVTRSSDRHRILRMVQSVNCRLETSIISIYNDAQPGGTPHYMLRANTTYEGNPFAA